MAKRTKKTVISGVSREQYEQAFAEFAMADAKAQSLTAKMDQEMTKIREKYADQLAELNETKDRTFEVMQTYATENKDTLFSKKKSLESAQPLQGVPAAVHPHHGGTGQGQAAGRPRHPGDSGGVRTHRRAGGAGRIVLRGMQEGRRCTGDGLSTRIRGEDKPSGLCTAMNTPGPHAQALPSRSATHRRKHETRFTN